MKKTKGFIGIITVLLISAIALLISTTILLRSITEATVSVDEEYSSHAWASVNACVEHALLELASSTDTVGWDYEGAETLDVGDYDCYILPIIGVGTGTSTSRTIQASSTVQDFTRKLEIVVGTNDPNVTVESWTEVADF